MRLSSSFYPVSFFTLKSEPFEIHPNGSDFFIYVYPNSTP